VTGNSGGAGPIPGSSGKPELARVGRSSGGAGQPETQELRIGEPDAEGNRSGHGTERRARSTGQPEFRASRTGESGAAGNRGSRRTGSETQQQRATGVAGDSTNRGGSGQPGLPKSGNEFQEAAGDRGFHGTPGNRSSGKNPGNRRFQRAACRLAQGNGDGTRAGSGGASSQALSDVGTRKLGSGSRSQIFEQFGQKGAKSRKGLRPLRFVAVFSGTNARADLWDVPVTIGFRTLVVGETRGWLPPILVATRTAS
jgi:hypothetical protein